MRVFGVLDGVLANQEWLVGNKCTIADLAFVSYVVNNVPVSVITDETVELCDAL